MIIPARYLLRMVAFLGVVGFGVFVIRDQLLAAFAANRFLNGLIVAVMFIGILFCLWLVIRLWREVGWIRRYQKNRDITGTAKPRLLAPMATMIGERGNRPLRLNASTMRSILDSVGARLDEGREISRYLIGLLVFLGLLGTFWGLIETIEAVSKAIQNLSVDSGDNFKDVFEQFKKDLLNSIGGAGTAFSTSLFGLAGSLVVGFLDLQAGQAQNRFFTILEDWLSGVTRLSSLPTELEEGDLQSSEAYLQALLEHTAEIMENIQQSLKETEAERIGTNSNLAGLTSKLGTLTANLQGEQTVIKNIAESQLAMQPVLDRLANEQTFGRQEMVNSLRSEFHNLTNRLTEINLGQQSFVQQVFQDANARNQELIQELRNEFRALERTLTRISSLSGNATATQGGSGPQKTER